MNYLINQQKELILEANKALELSKFMSSNELKFWKDQLKKAKKKLATLTEL